MINRSEIIDIARQWIGTPYHHNARVLGAGVDCGQILIAVYSAAGLMPKIETGYYARDFMLHRDDEQYLSYVMRYCQETDDPLPGDIAVWKIGRIYSHGGIVEDWPYCIHAYMPHGKVLWQDITETDLAHRPVRFFTFDGQ